MDEEQPRPLVYDDSDTAIIQIIFSEGFLSPGGPEEVAETLGPVDLAGKTVLDFGCGIGGIDVALVENHDADKVVGIDVSESAIQQARRRAADRGLKDRLKFRLVEPGPLALDDASFDAAFSAGVLLHVPDKSAVLGELFRVLRPGGWLVLSDWFRGEADFSPEMREWLRVSGIEYMETLEATRRLVAERGFEEIATRDRTDWYRAEVEREVARVHEAYDRIVELLGEEGARSWLEPGELRRTVVHQGQIRPGHLRARKPAR